MVGGVKEAWDGDGHDVVGVGVRVGAAAGPRLLVEEPMRVTLHLGDCRTVMAAMEPNSIDAIVTDPPAGINFMNKAFDSDRGGRDHWIAWLTAIMAEAFRVAKPGAHALVWAFPRTSGWTQRAMEDAGWEVRDVVTHLFGSGFPKSLDVGKAMDRAAGAERDVVGENPYNSLRTGGRPPKERPTDIGRAVGQSNITAPATDLARQWDGWGTNLKPAAEFWFLCRKPLAKGMGVAANVTAYGTGALNVDATRIGSDVMTEGRMSQSPGGVLNANGRDVEHGSWKQKGNFTPATHAGRWPANVLIESGEVAAMLDEQSGLSKSQIANRKPQREMTSRGYKGGGLGQRRARDHEITDVPKPEYQDTGGASRFFANIPPDAPIDDGAEHSRMFYTPKASRAERNAGLDGMPERAAGVGDERPSGQSNERRKDRVRGPVIAANHHPTVKPISLMRWLCRLITPPGGTILDPFMGSGSTGCAAVLEGFDFTGIEMDESYLEIARLRINHWRGPVFAATV